MIDDAIEYLTKMLIKQFEKDKEQKEYINISKQDLLKKSIKLLKMVK